MKIIDPLDRYTSPQPIRILSDNGIRQALDFGLIKISPKFDYRKDSDRIQPATLDVRIQQIDEVEAILPLFEKTLSHRPNYRLSLQARHISTVELTELIDFGQLSSCNFNNFFGISSEVRSSARLLGAYMARSGAYFFSDPQYSYLEIGNFSQNDIHLKKEDRIAQLFFLIFPFRDYFGIPVGEHPKNETGEKVRSLEMGVSVTDDIQLTKLVYAGYIEISPKLKSFQGKILVHANNTAYRMKNIEEDINFNKIKQYTKKELFKPVNIKHGYTVKPFEHIIIDTKENFKLTPHVGIRFWDNTFFYKEITANSHMEDWEALYKNADFFSLTDGWIDPNYKGSFTRQPKWLTGRTIYPGDVIGFGQVFYFPEGVGKPYGEESIGSQYQEKDRFT